MNLRTGAFLVLLCTGLTSAQLNYRPEFLSAGQGFRAASQYQSKSLFKRQVSQGGDGSEVASLTPIWDVFPKANNGSKDWRVVSKRQAPGGDGSEIIPHDMKKQTTFWWVAPETPFKTTKIGGGVQETPRAGGVADESANDAAGGAAQAGQAGAFAGTQSTQQSNFASRTTVNGITGTGTVGAIDGQTNQIAGQANQFAGQANQFAGQTNQIGSTTRVGTTSSSSSSRTVGTQTGAGLGGLSGIGRTTFTRTSTTQTTGTGVNGVAGTGAAVGTTQQFGQTTGTSRTEGFSSTRSITSTGTAGSTQPPNVIGGVTTTGTRQQSVSTTTIGVPPVQVPGQSVATTQFDDARTDITTTNNQNTNNISVNRNINTVTSVTDTVSQQPPPPETVQQTNTYASRTSTTATGLPFSPNLPSPGAGSTITRTQTRTDEGYNYPVPTPVPCYEPTRICTPNQYCVDGFVEENLLSQFTATNQNCDTATEQCCKIRPAPPPPPPTQCPDNSYVCVPPSLCNNGKLNFDAQNAISSQQPNGQCFAPDVCCKTIGLETQSTVLTNEGYVVRVPDNQYLPPEGQNTNTNIQTAPPPPPPPQLRPQPRPPQPRPQYPTPRPQTPPPPPPPQPRPVTPPPPPPPTRYTPPATTPRYVPAPSTISYAPPQTTSRYFPPPAPTRPSYRGDEYIPPREEVPASSNDDPNAVRPPQDEVPNPANDTPIAIRPNQPRPAPPPQPSTPNGPVGGPAPPLPPPIGCSAAMNCTEPQFCSATGVITKTPVFLTPEQELYRVPVTECRSPDRGFTGVCCRDPDYVDPWPVGMLGLYNPEILPFDDGSYKPNGNGNGNGNGNRNGNSITSQVTRNEAIQAAPSRVTVAQTYGPNQITSASQTQYTQAKTQYDRGVTAAASSTSTTFQQQQSTSTTNGVKRYNPSGLQFVHSGNTRFKPFQKQGSGQCAPRNYNTQPRGAGPWDTGFGEFPWQAMVILESNKTLLCGGAIISENTVVTSADCVYGLNPRDIMIKGGEWRLGVDAEPKTFQIVRVKNVVYHPAYQPTTSNYDVAMLVLEDRLRFDTHIGQICLDENDVIPSASYENCVTTGWGREVLRIHIGNALMRYMPISLLSEADSQRQLQANGITPESHIAGRPAADACDVDIGSALACADTSGSYFLKGVYSSDNGCGRPDQIASFSNIDVQWIRQVLKNPNQFITPVPNYQTAANSPIVSTIQQPSTLGPNYGKAYLPPYK